MAPAARFRSRTRHRTITPSIGDSYRCRACPAGLLAVHIAQVWGPVQSPTVVLGTVRSGAPMVSVASHGSGPGSDGHRSW